MPTIGPLAAVDLGSNSFRLEIGHAENGHYVRDSYLRETIRLGNGLDGDACLSSEAMQRGWNCLARFGQELRGFHPNSVQAVSTQTLREARNRDVFLATGNRLLGFPIRVISGAEEAALIYQGAAQTIAKDFERRIVIDIGGRSTELILGTGSQVQLTASCPIGSVAWSMRYFPDATLTEAAFNAAELAARATLQDACMPFTRDRWDCAYGSAGTINAVVDVLTAAGWPSAHVSRAGLDWLQQQLVQASHVDHLHLPGLRDDRKPVIGGGLSVLRALFDLLAIDQLVQCSGGLRHGLLQGMIKKARSEPGL